MSGRVAVVTDSTANLPPELLAGLGVHVVPLDVTVGGTSLRQNSSGDGDRVAQALRDGLPVTTSRPAPAVFVEVYRRLWDAGATGIVSVHLSADMSGTVDSARLAAAEVGRDGLAVEVVDSRSIGMGLGFGVLTAARAAASGGSVSGTAQAALRRTLNTSVFLYLDTLEHLRRGGRIGSAQAWIGSALTIKPLLALTDGRLEPLDRVRTTERAVARLVEVAVAEAGSSRVDVAVQHLAAAERAQEVARRLRERIAGLGELVMAGADAAIGAHVGPGVVGVVVAPMDPV